MTSKIDKDRTLTLTFPKQERTYMELLKLLYNQTNFNNLICYLIRKERGNIQEFVCDDECNESHLRRLNEEIVQQFKEVEEEVEKNELQ